ncbi:MAG: hypothetical protein K2W82_18795 [Candidatus Obscuribacterales bacterium]|nr:hypothetical protein [Candidatus Obscuribacterales bacterium]
MNQILCSQLLLVLLLSACFPQAQAEVLKGSVQEQGKRDDAAGLRRSDVDPLADPFAGDNDKDLILEAPKEAFKMDKPGKPVKPFNLQAQEQRRAPVQAMQPMPGNFNPFDGQGDNMPEPPLQQGRPVIDPQDPDSTPEMQLLWDAWHKQVAEAIYARFNFLAKVAFRHSPPLLCRISYVVTRDGHIQNPQIQEKSANILFNVIVFQTVKSLDGDVNLLQFPPGSKRMMVPKNGTFTQNYGGDGFRYTMGDRETLPNR